MLLTPRTFHRAGGFASWLHLGCCCGPWYRLYTCPELVASNLYIKTIDAFAGAATYAGDGQCYRVCGSVINTLPGGATVVVPGDLTAGSTCCDVRRLDVACVGTTSSYFVRASDVALNERVIYDGVLYQASALLTMPCSGTLLEAPDIHLPGNPTITFAGMDAGVCGNCTNIGLSNSRVPSALAIDGLTVVLDGTPSMSFPPSPPAGRCLVGIDSATDPYGGPVNMGTVNRYSLSNCAGAATACSSNRLLVWVQFNPATLLVEAVFVETQVDTAPGWPVDSRFWFFRNPSASHAFGSPIPKSTNCASDPVGNPEFSSSGTVTIDWENPP